VSADTPRYATYSFDQGAEVTLIDEVLSNTPFLLKAGGASWLPVFLATTPYGAGTAGCLFSSPATDFSVSLLLGGALTECLHLSGQQALVEIPYPL